MNSSYSPHNWRASNTDKPLPMMVNIMGLLIFVMVGRAQEFIPGIIGLPLAKVLFVILALLVFVSREHDQDQPFVHPQVKVFSFLFALGLISSLTSLWPSHSLEFMVVSFVAQGLFVFFLIKVGISWQAVWRICWSLIFTAMIMCFTTLTNYEEGRAELSGISYDTNDLAFLLVILLPFFYFMAKAIEKKVVKLLLFACTGVVIVTVLLTQSRGGFIGLMVVFAAIMLHEKVRPMPVLLLGTFLLLLLSFYAPEGYWERMSNIGNQQEDYNMTAKSGRLEIWKRGIDSMFANPVLGVGPNAFSIADGKSLEVNGKWSAAHNSFIQIGAELGITGLSLFLYMIVKSLRVLRDARHKLQLGAPEAGLLRAVEVGFYGYLSAGFFLSQAYATIFFLLVGLSVVAANLTRKDSVETPLIVCLNAGAVSRARI